jgi:hypothetical protein
MIFVRALPHLIINSKTAKQLQRAFHYNHLNSSRILKGIAELIIMSF